jgi:hypothetical protein
MNKKKKLLRWFSIVRYYFNCLWFYVLFPIGDKGDDFAKMIHNKKNKKHG